MHVVPAEIDQERVILLVRVGAGAADADRALGQLVASDRRGRGGEPGRMGDEGGKRRLDRGRQQDPGGGDRLPIDAVSAEVALGQIAIPSLEGQVPPSSWMQLRGAGLDHDTAGDLDGLPELCDRGVERLRDIRTLERVPRHLEAPQRPRRPDGVLERSAPDQDPSLGKALEGAFADALPVAREGRCRERGGEGGRGEDQQAARP
jgi:hypothetical protein